MMRETLDEVIDRVAGEMTAVASEPEFTARLESRLAVPSSRAPLWSVTVPVMAAVLVAAVVISTGRRSDAPARDEIPIASDTTRSAPVETSAARAGAVPAVAPALVPAQPRHRARVEVIEPQVPAIAALGAPDVLTVDLLNVQSLTIAPVEFGHLDMADLEVRDIGTEGEFKEQ
jgi:hypothetical protein